MRSHAQTAALGDDDDSQLKQLRKSAQSVFVVLLNSLILLCALEASIGLARFAVQTVRALREDPKKLALDEALLKRIYPTLSIEEIARLRREAVAMQEYAPWVEFRGKNKNGAYEHSSGFLRQSLEELSAYPAKTGADGVLDVFFLGGSTVYGVNVPDTETIPSHFARLAKERKEAVRLRVWNFGQPYYSSKQEMFLLFSLVTEGKRPDVVIFIDGLNEVLQTLSSYRGHPFWTPQLRVLFAKVNEGLRSADLAQALWERSNLYHVLMRAGLIHSKPFAASSYSHPASLSHEEIALGIFENYMTTVRVTQELCKGMRIACYFFWQPVPFHQYDRMRDPICDKREVPLFSLVFPMVKSQSRSTSRLYYLGDALEAYGGELPFADHFHYSPAFNRFLADQILSRVQLP